MNITFESANIGQKDAHALIAFLTALYPLPATPSIPSSLPPAPPAPPVEMPQTVSQPGPVLVADQPPTTQSSPEPTTTRKRRTKAEIAADEAAAAQQAQNAPADLALTDPPNASAAPAAEASATTQPAPAPQTTVGADELRSLLNGYIAKHSMEDAIGKLREFNCNRVTEALSLPADQLSLLAAALRG